MDVLSDEIISSKDLEKRCLIPLNPMLNFSKKPFAMAGAQDLFERIEIVEAFKALNMRHMMAAAACLFGGHGNGIFVAVLGMEAAGAVAGFALHVFERAHFANFAKASSFHKAYAVAADA